MFAGDIPRRDEPLPRLIDDAAAAKLLRAAREHPDPFTRLAVEFLARTGLRKGEISPRVLRVVLMLATFWAMASRRVRWAWRPLLLMSRDSNMRVSSGGV